MQLKEYDKTTNSLITGVEEGRCGREEVWTRSSLHILIEPPNKVLEVVHCSNTSFRVHADEVIQVVCTV